MTQPFAKHSSIVRIIWGDQNMVMFIFAGAAAEFALNKAVDWLYFTGKLPTDPLGRMYSTVAYANKIIFASEEDACKAIDTIAAIHKGVEQARGMPIPEEAYRDVLYMLIDYTIRTYTLLAKPMTAQQKEDVYDVFYRMGTRMGLQDLPATYDAWLPDRTNHMRNNLVMNKHTPDLFAQYRKHLGWMRYKIMWQVQAHLAPFTVARLLKLRPHPAFTLALSIMARYRNTKWMQQLKQKILPDMHSGTRVQAHSPHMAT